MYLKSLTLRGFKSFASATTLNFEPGITAIVGPNGSGKSNIVDALSWVMGEQAAKSLRGGKMEDVIFAGTSGRPPLGRAEVTLTIDNTDGVLPIEYTEVTISRTLFRAGGSEYAINGRQSRLLDVQELLSDTGMGREMHVIVGQGQLDAILQATPEQRRGFIEEAAGVLKHRKRKEKASRKLDSTQANMARLSDLVAEIRRQLKPLGRQAEVARRAAMVQADLRDAKARLLADELTQLSEALEADLVGEEQHRRARENAEAALAQARTAEQSAEQAVTAAMPTITRSQETWYGLAALRERVSTTVSISAERMRYAADQPVVAADARDPQRLEQDAAQIREEEAALRETTKAADDLLTAASAHRNAVEQSHAEAERAYSAQLRAIADRREGLARLHGQVNSLKSRIQAGAEEHDRLAERQAEARARAEEAEHSFTVLETRITGLGDGEIGLDAEFETVDAECERLETQLDELRRDETRVAQERASLAARVEALELGLERQGASGALLVAGDELSGLLGSVAALVSVESGYETAVSAALGAAAEAVAVQGIESALDAVALLKAKDLGRAGLLLGGVAASPNDWPDLPDGVRYAVDVVTAQPVLQGALTRLLRKVVVVDSLGAAQDLIGRLPELLAVTRDGDVLSAWFVAGGSASKASLIEVQAAVDSARAALGKTQHELERVRFALAEQGALAEQARHARDVALERLNESDAQMAALAEQLGTLGQTGRAARSEADRLQQTIADASVRRRADEEALLQLEERLRLADRSAGAAEPDPSQRDRLADEARVARQAEMEARLALRTAEERVKSLAGRADSLQRAAAHERGVRAQAKARAEQRRREAAVAAQVNQAARWLIDRVERVLERAHRDRLSAEQDRLAAETALIAARRLSRERSQVLDQLVEGAHRDEMVRIEQRMRIEQLSDKAMSELGLEARVLMDEYGPHLLVPVLGPTQPAADFDDVAAEPPAVPYLREEQQRRLRAAERDLQVLGRVNPLALEEFDAMSERHAFLAEQLEDLKRTRKDLLEIIDEVDNRVQEVFSAAYADVAGTFTQVFARLFPGGEGSLTLTDPEDLLVTGVDVEARPAGKKVKRLSLLSGGERSLVAVAFLLSLFIARPSPFYILDEVEAALDDVNLSRLLDIYRELGTNSQLLVITHQKRTMEIADALYGVTMRNDGVSTVISQRLRES